MDLMLVFNHSTTLAVAKLWTNLIAMMLLENKTLMIKCCNFIWSMYI